MLQLFKAVKFLTDFDSMSLQDEWVAGMRYILARTFKAEQVMSI